MNLGFLRPLYDETGDYVSVYLDTDRSHENALTAIELRWNAARQRRQPRDLPPRRRVQGAGEGDGAGPREHRVATGLAGAAGHRRGGVE